MNRQEILNKVYRYFSQPYAVMARTISIDGEAMCHYRMEHEGRTVACAIGCLIPDKLYREEMEGQAVSEVVTLPGLREVLGVSYNRYDAYDDIGFLTQLQQAHDSAGNVAEVLSNLQDICREYDLIIPA